MFRRDMLSLAYCAYYSLASSWKQTDSFRGSSRRYVYTVKRLFLARFIIIPPICNSPFHESFKRIPFGTDIYAATTIILVTLSMGISASLSHVNPKIM